MDKLPLTQEELKAVYEDCGFDLQKTADQLGLEYADFALNYGHHLVPAPLTLAPRRRQPPANLGQEWCRKHKIAVRHCQNPHWPRTAEAVIEDARAKYEAGTHEILTGRDRDWFILYSVPRHTRCGVRRFFQVS